MTSPVFADSSYFFALLNPRDGHHSIAVRLNTTLHRPLVTTTWVLSEVGDGLASFASRRLFLPFVERLRATPAITIVPPSSSLFDAAIHLFDSRLDKHWSVTDCVSFLVMGQSAMADALTADHHFEQAGFTAMLLHP